MTLPGSGEDGRRWPGALAWAFASLLMAAGARAQGMGPDLPPGFYGLAPSPFPGPQAPAGVKRLALVYSGCLVGEIEPCG